MRISLAILLAAAQYGAAVIALATRGLPEACQFPGKPCANVANIGECIAILNQGDKTMEDFDKCIAMVGDVPAACVACILLNFGP